MLRCFLYFNERQRDGLILAPRNLYNSDFTRLKLEELLGGMYITSGSGVRGVACRGKVSRLISLS